MKIFGMEVVTDSSSPRYNVWEIEKLAYYSLVLGLINIIVLLIFSFEAITYLIVFFISAAVLYLTRERFLRISAEHIKDIATKINSDQIFNYDSPEEMIVDVKEDDQMNILTGKIETQLTNIFIFTCILSIIVFLLVVFVDLPINFLNILFLNFWVYLSMLLTEQAVEASITDFGISLKAGAERMYALDTIRRG